MSKYPFESIEPKWQKYWEVNKTFKVGEDASVPKEKRGFAPLSLKPAINSKKSVTAKSTPMPADHLPLFEKS